MKKRDPSVLGFVLPSALVLGLVLGLVWGLAMREKNIRGLYIEYEAYRASAALLEALRQDPTLVPDDSRILGFGVYSPEGEVIHRTGSAPSSIAKGMATTDSIRISRRSLSIVLERPLGPEAPDRPGMRGMLGQQGQLPQAGQQAIPEMQRQQGLHPMYGQQRRLMQEQFQPGPLAAGQQPGSLWLEYGLGGYSRVQLVIFAAAGAATLALLGLYALLLVLYRKNSDLRERELRNRELVQLGEAARTLVHEIKNPLGVIRVQAAALRRLEPATAVAKAVEKADSIEEEVLRLAGLADRIRSFLKGGEGEPRELELAPWLRSFASRYSSGSALAVGGLAEGAYSRIDPERLSQAMDNLVANAFEAASEGFKPEISLVPAKGHRVAQRATGRGDPRRSVGFAWEIVVADRGRGVPAELVERIFEPFFTTKEKGSGIGLSLARRIARAAGGDLVYRPRPEGGSIFALTLPASR